MSKTHWRGILLELKNMIELIRDPLKVGTKLNSSRDTSQEVLAVSLYSSSVICSGSANRNNVNAAEMKKEALA